VTLATAVITESVIRMERMKLGTVLSQLVCASKERFSCSDFALILCPADLAGAILYLGIRQLC
jgi:hypothetical protein